MSLNAMFTAPALPLLFELAAMIRKYSLRKPLLFLQHSCCLSRRQLMIKLFSTNDEPAIVVDANQKPVSLALNSEWPFEVYLLKLIRTFSPKEIPALKLVLVPVLFVPCENGVYCFPGKLNSLNAAHRILDEVW